VHGVVFAVLSPAQGRDDDLPKNIQRRVLQQHDGLGIRNAARRRSWPMPDRSQFQHLDVLALVGDAAAAADLASMISYSATKKCSFSVTEPGLHEGLEHFFDLAEPVAVSSSASALIRFSGEALSSRPAAASIIRSS